ncbi:MAG: winged helix-turn-helix domain-containing protein [Acidimicrobiales bacterium]|nr:winged helix-turn-helix domain-containing protein [Acidimicrobiales bacterium]
MDVSVLRWPADADRRLRLAHIGQPRLLVVDPDATPPASSDCLEDWIRAPASEVDLQARIEGLRRRHRHHRISVRTERPALDTDGVLRFDGRWVSLPPVEARLMRALVARFGAVVSREHLTRAGWPDGSPGRNALDVHVLRLRRRIEPIGLVIKTVRSRGYLLETTTVADEAGDTCRQV